MSDDFESQLYNEYLIDLYNNPLNYGKIENPTNSCHEHNDLCGDDITVYLTIEDDIIKDVKFSGSGCSLMMASASLLTDDIKGKKISEIMSLDDEDLKKLVQMPVTDIRIKCLTLPLVAIRNSLSDKTGKPKIETSCGI